MKAKSHSARLRCTNVNWISWSKDRVDHSAPHHSVRTGDRARACLDYSTFQTSISDRRSVCFCHASLVSVNHGHCFGACTGAGYFPVAGRPPLVAPGSLVVIVLPLLAATWLARQNHFEWMFHPLPNAAYARPGGAAFVADADMVMAIESNGDAVAYPIRLMAYHHLVQDTVGDTAYRRDVLNARVTPVWCGKTTVNGRQLHFHLAGINNQISSCATRRRVHGGSK